MVMTVRPHRLRSGLKAEDPPQAASSPAGSSRIRHSDRRYMVGGERFTQTAPLCLTGPEGCGGENLSLIPHEAERAARLQALRLAGKLAGAKEPSRTVG